MKVASCPISTLLYYHLLSLLDIKDIQHAQYIKGDITTGPCFQCVFENDVLINNTHATGCNISFMNINTTERNYTLFYRENGSSFVFDYFKWFLSGYYDICYTSLSFLEDCEVSQYSVYINGTEQGNQYSINKKCHNLFFTKDSQAKNTDGKIFYIII